MRPQAPDAAERPEGRDAGTGPGLGDARPPDTGVECDDEVDCFTSRGLVPCERGASRWSCGAGVCASLCVGDCAGDCDCETGMCVDSRCVLADNAPWPCPACTLMGAGCTEAPECGTACLPAAAGFPDGLVTLPCAQDADCVVGGRCEQRPGAGFCVQTCTSTADCRTGYACRPLIAGGLPACWPPD